MAEQDESYDGRLRKLEMAMASIQTDHTRVMDALFNGDDGVHGLMAWISRQDERQLTEMRFHEKRDAEIKAALKTSNDKVMRTLTIIGLLIALVAAFLTIPAAVNEIKKGAAEIPEFFHSMKSRQVYSATKAVPQDAAQQEGRPWQRQ